LLAVSATSWSTAATKTWQSQVFFTIPFRIKAARRGLRTSETGSGIVLPEWWRRARIVSLTQPKGSERRTAEAKQAYLAHLNTADDDVLRALLADKCASGDRPSAWLRRNSSTSGRPLRQRELVEALFRKPEEVGGLLERCPRILAGDVQLAQELVDGLARDLGGKIRARIFIQRSSSGYSLWSIKVPTTRRLPSIVVPSRPEMMMASTTPPVISMERLSFLVSWLSQSRFRRSSCRGFRAKPSPSS
jgi:hypothetical protein